jgi:hypothetical protein
MYHLELTPKPWRENVFVMDEIAENWPYIAIKKSLGLISFGNRNIY